ncbi:hypothetical protein P9112_014024 [Eukaryota sp. TZLM1-RC]
MSRSNSRLNQAIVSDAASDILTPYKRKVPSRPIDHGQNKDQRELSATLHEFHCTDFQPQALDPDDCPFVNVGANFWRLLADSTPTDFNDWMEIRLAGQPVNVIVPDTIVLGDSDKLAWFASSETGTLFKRVNFEPNDVISELFKSSTAAFCLQKRVSHFRDWSTETSIVDLKEVTSLLSKPNEPVILQQFVKPRGIKPTVYRIYLEREKAPKIISVTSEIKFDDLNVRDVNLRFLVNSHDAPTSVFTVNNAALRSVIDSAINMKEAAQKINLAWNITHFVADFIINDSNNSFFVQCKVIQSESRLVQQLSSTNLLGTDQPIEDEVVKSGSFVKKCQKYAKCRMCYLGFPSKEFKHQLTINMIKQTINHLIDRGVFLNYFGRVELISNRNDSSKYETCRVCSSCYNLFLIENELRSIESNFAIHTGIRLTSNSYSGGSYASLDSLPVKSNALTGERLMSSSVMEHTDLDDLNINISPSKTEFKCYRALIFIHDVVGLTFSSNIDLDSCELQSSLFDENFTFPICVTQETSEIAIMNTPRAKRSSESNSEENDTVYRGFINKLVTKYLFCKEDDLKNFLAYLESFYFFLFTGKKSLFGSFLIDIKSLSKNPFHKQECSAILNSASEMPCRLRITLLCQEIEQFNFKKAVLFPKSEFKHVYYPLDSQFFTVDPIPQEFLNILPYKSRTERDFAKKFKVSKRELSQPNDHQIDNQIDCSSMFSPSEDQPRLEDLDFDDLELEPAQEISVFLSLELHSIYNLVDSAIALGVLDGHPSEMELFISFIEDFSFTISLSPSLNFQVNKSIDVLFKTYSLSKFLSELPNLNSVPITFKANDQVIGKTAINLSKFLNNTQCPLPFNKPEAFDIDLFKDGVVVEQYMGEEMPWISTELVIHEEENESEELTSEYFGFACNVTLNNIGDGTFLTTLS